MNAEVKQWVIFASVIVISLIIGFLIGRFGMKRKGEILFEPVNEDGEERIKCIFKLDMEIEDLAKQSYILFKVQKGSQHLQLL